MHGRGGLSRSGPPGGEVAAREKAMRSIFGEVPCSLLCLFQFTHHACDDSMF